MSLAFGSLPAACRVPILEIMRNETQQAAINMLHFHPKWFEFNLLDNSFFAQQVALFQAGGDDIWLSSEHHRFAAFNLILSQRACLTDEEVKQYVELCELDEDRQGMAISALICLFSWSELTTAQRQWLLGQPAYQNEIIQGGISRFQGENS